MRFALHELQQLPTLSVGHFDDLKIEQGPLRVWLSRMGVEDGQPYPDKVTVEARDKDGVWHVIDEYPAG